jgi:hypothetical protein
MASGEFEYMISNMRLDDAKGPQAYHLRIDRSCWVKSGRMTTHYSQAELSNLIEAAEKVCDAESRKTPATTWLRRKTG